jgi:tRNA threonylcarbamoyl adenosine modification protein YjeE
MSTVSHSVRTDSAPATEALAERLGAFLVPGLGLALQGELGAGKTVFVRGLARGLRVDEPDEVRSPTYLMMVEHPGPVPLVHVDAYFRDKGVRLHEEGGLMAFDPRAVVAVEWPERLASGIPADWLRVRIEVVGEAARELTLSGVATPWAAILAQCGLAV